MEKKRTSGSIVFRLLAILCIAAIFLPSVCRAQSNDAQKNILAEKPQVIQITTENGNRITVYDKAFLLERPLLPHYPPILHVQGTPYEMGYQHGVLLADRITELVSGVGSPMMFMLGGWNPESGEKPTQEQLETGRSLCLMVIQQCFIEPIKEKAPDYFDEMQGLADGLKAAGSPVGLDEILAAITLAELSQSRGLIENMAAELSKGCSDFAAWGKATKDGNLIHGTNYDNEDFTIARKGIVLIAKPESGNAFLGMINPGMPWPMRGMSAAGITVGEPTSISADNDILAKPQVGHCVHMRRVLQYANNTQDAISIMKELGGSTGWNIFTTDGKVPTAVDIQVSSTKTAVIYPVQGMDVLWSTNQFTAYPGYQGYPEDGINLVKDQMQYWGVPWNEVDTIEKWQSFLRENKMSKESNTWARYERLRELGKQNYGEITPEKVIEFMSDPVLSDADEEILISVPVKHQFGWKRPIISQGMASVFSAVFVPADGMAYVAIGAEPAQAGIYWPINLKDHLELMESFIAKDIYNNGMTSIESLFQKWADKTEKEKKQR